MIKIYTDGSTRQNGKKDAPGAWGFIVIGEQGEIIHKAAAGVKPATNQAMELMAAAEACEWAAENYDTFTSITIISDSAYLINACHDKWYVKWQSNGWTTSNKSSVVNQHLWERLIPFFDSANFRFMKCKGHAGEKWNCEVDEMVQGITESMMK